MNYLTAAHSDVGIRKKTNQDSLLIEQAQTEDGSVLLAVICDGMGGLAKGEVASARVIRSFSRWFEEELPEIYYGGMDRETLQRSLSALIAEENRRVVDYGREAGVSLGTTCVSFLAAGGRYCVMNVGDSRAYRITDTAYQITKDHTLVQQQADAGIITAEEAEKSPQRNILLQCIGGGDEYVAPDFFFGALEEGENYMLCCDGFRHELLPMELVQYLGPRAAADRDVMKNNLVYLTELNKQRMETDNITALLIHTV